jgi:hypothetical protein
MSKDKDFEITIQSTRGTKQFSFPKQNKVSDVISQAISAFGFASGDNFELMLASNTSEALNPERPLVSFNLEDGAVLILTATGSGV